MEPSTVIHIVIHSFTLICLFILAVGQARNKRLSARAIAKRLDAIELFCADLEERHASLHASHKKLNSRVAMRQARAKLAEEVLDNGNPFARREGETEIEWKRRCRAAIANGAIRHGD